MKKTFLTAFVVLLAMLAVSCDGFIPQSDDGIQSVQYTMNGNSIKSVTLRLDGAGGPDRKVSRALTGDLAKAGHDYFEVVFTDSGNVVRASWELGDAAGIKNVPRGVDYGTAAKAILFVGRKADKTLLAVGLLTDAKDAAGASSGTTVNNTSTTATFTVAALTAGTTFVPATSSFLTATGGAADNTNIPAAATTEILTLTDSITSKSFPLYHITKNIPQTNAIYTIGSTGAIASYTPGIIVAAVPTAIQPKIPRYPRGGGLYYEAKSPHALSTKVTYTNNITADTAFVPGITFAIETDGASNQEGAISFGFDIPVYAITSTATPDGVNALTWHIRPGFGINRYDLDDGIGSAGGSILLGVGDTTTLDWLDIIVVGP